MAPNFNGIRLLERKKIVNGEKLLYSADFNINYSIKNNGSIELKDAKRVYDECEDLKYISKNGGITVILAHQGRYNTGDIIHLDFIASYLSKKLKKEVKYFPENNTRTAIEFVNKLQPGDIAVMGNTRFHAGEEENDSNLAEQFANLVMRAKLKGCAAIGGFGKAHRAHASNVGILKYLPGYATRSQIKEMKLLENWAGRREKIYSVAVLGGVKKEKIIEGLAGFSRTYDCIIPGGIVLNTIFLVQGKKIGSSVVKDDKKRYDSYVKEILKLSYAKKICIPKEVIIAKPVKNGFEDAKNIQIDKGVPKGYMIVDFILSHSALKALEKLESQGGRLVLAGTPGVYKAGFRTATDIVLNCMKKSNVDAIVLGGDTASETKFKGPSSTGGGSALSFVAKGTTPVYEALKINKKKFPL